MCAGIVDTGDDGKPVESEEEEEEESESESEEEEEEEEKEDTAAFCCWFMLDPTSLSPPMAPPTERRQEACVL